VDHTARFPGIAAAVAGLLAPQLILDGEVCVFDDQLVSQFHLLGPDHGLEAWAMVKQQGWEGLVAKDPTAPLQRGLHVALAQGEGAP
jgi:ATP-dependent DNA ligase